VEEKQKAKRDTFLYIKLLLLCFGVNIAFLIVFAFNVVENVRWTNGAGGLLCAKEGEFIVMATRKL